MPSVWRVQPHDAGRARALADALRIHPVTAQLLLNRRIEEPSAGWKFLQPGLDALEDPWALSGMEAAVARLKLAAHRHEPVMIFGDSDVDGLTASVILYEVLRERGADVRAKSSNRILDGYGLPASVVRELGRSGVTLLILVDCGTNQAEDVAWLQAQGIDTVIVDHHVALGAPAQPRALINPHCDGSKIGRGLCSAGLALKVAQAMFDDDRAQLEPYLDLAALGTLADCSPLVGDSRVIVSEGLPRIIQTRRQGLARLCEATGTDKPDPDVILRRLTPRLNASGRLGDAEAIRHLLLRGEEERLEEWLSAADAAHATTKQLHRQIMAEAQEQVNRLHFRDQYVMVVSRSGWHQGLMGPLATQLAHRYGRPAIAISMDEQQGTGSARSIPHFNLFEALQACQELLVKFGGHAQACGLTVDRKHLERFREVVNEQAKQLLGRDGLVQTKTIDLELALEDVAPSWVGEAAGLAPFGQGNPRPTVAIRRLTVEQHSPRMATVSDGVRRVAARGVFPALVPGGSYDVVASPVMAAGELVLTLGDVRASAAPSEPARTSGSSYRPAPA